MAVCLNPTDVTAEKDNFVQHILQQISLCCKKETNLMISVFDVKGNKFLYCNDSFVNILGFSKNEIINGGWEFWFKQIDPSEARNVKNKIDLLVQKTSFARRLKPFTFNYHIRNIFNCWCFINHEISFHQIERNLIVINYLHDISQKEQIEYFFEKKKHILLDDYKSIVISKREKEVLQLIAEGFSSKQIAKELYISSHTAIAHRKNLIEKFKVKNTAQLIKEASQSILL